MKRISNDQGNAILEAISFVAVSFGLILLSGVQLFTIQRDQLELSLLSRNVMTSFLNSTDTSLAEQLVFWKSRSGFSDQQVAMNVRCSPDCLTRGSIVIADLSYLGQEVRVFGVLGD